MVDYIEYKGQQLPFKICYYSLSRFQKETGKDLSVINDISKNMYDFEILIYHAFKAGHLMEGKEMTITRDDVPFILDKGIEQALQAISDSNPEDQEDKKKQVAKEVNQ